MHKIKLVPDAPFYNSCDIAVYDVTDGREKKRCKITAEYAQVDVEAIKKDGRDTIEKAMEYYREWIYAVVRHYISDDWEAAGGYDETMQIIDEHIKQYYEEDPA